MVNATNQHVTPVPGRRRLTLWTILAAQLMLQMDFLIVALPRIEQDLGFSLTGPSWIPDAFALAFGGLLLFGSQFGDMLGQARVFRFGSV